MIDKVVKTINKLEILNLNTKIPSLTAEIRGRLEKEEGGWRCCNRSNSDQQRMRGCCNQESKTFQVDRELTGFRIEILKNLNKNSRLEHFDELRNHLIQIAYDPVICVLKYWSVLIDVYGYYNL